MNDKEIRDKIDNLPALEGGIVFGADEAWEKLDARLQRTKKKSIILFRVRWAAAAMLLIAVAMMYTLRTPVTINATIAELPVAEKKLPATINTDTPTTIVATTTPPNKNRETSPKVIVNKKYPVPDTQVLAVAPIPPTPPDTQKLAPIQEIPKPKMVLVHINDVETPEATTQAVAWSGPSLDISKMKIVTLADVEKKSDHRIPPEDVAIVYRVPRYYESLPLLRRYSNEKNTTSTTHTLSLRFNK